LNKRSSVSDGHGQSIVKKNGHFSAERQAEKLLDDVGWHILAELQADGRVPFAELGRRVGLSTPAVIERVRRLEEAGVITGYHATVDPTRIGLGVLALVRVRTAARSETGQRLGRMLADCPEVVEAHHVTGDDCYVCKVHVASVGHLERLIEELGHYGSTTTSLVLSSPVARRAFDRPSA
jgi:Lrp/AsnC family leucine-responsive transcriptional regulator